MTTMRDRIVEAVDGAPGIDPRGGLHAAARSVLDAAEEAPDVRPTLASALLDLANAYAADAEVVPSTEASPRQLAEAIEQSVRELGRRAEAQAADLQIKAREILSGEPSGEHSAASSGLFGLRFELASDYRHLGAALEGVINAATLSLSLIAAGKKPCDGTLDLAAYEIPAVTLSICQRAEMVELLEKIVEGEGR